ncbi:MAG: VTT domain-containing protein [Nitrososphaerota archaeon]|nr:VTT domain-containing protein [Candidatus Bathyarchaeota archaeon]MDW8048615.1 VTT domain-containing protein [Nitrososphaerota archaeon]
MEKRYLISIIALVGVAVISAVILYHTLFVGNIVEEIGLSGIFLVSMLSHLTIIGRDLFAPAFISLTPFYNPVILGFSAGIGAAVGEVTTYYWGLGISNTFQKGSEESQFTRWMKKYGNLALLIVASSPLPDTPIALLAGSSRLPIGKFLMIQIVGKTLFYSLAAAAGGFIFAQLSDIFGELLLSTLVVAASLALCVIASWNKGREKVLKLLRMILH